MLDYVTLPTKDLEAAKAFFETVLGLEVGYRPTFPFAGHWVYAAGRPIVHLIPGQGGPVDRTGETIYHVAFRLDDHEALRLKLDRLSIPYSQMDLPKLGERRLFIRTPTGVLLELVFRDGAPNPSHPQVRSRFMPHEPRILGRRHPPTGPMAMRERRSLALSSMSSGTPATRPC
jgi:catechol 2,3-dioxygenase-like lactoylglutathione lyase family enzyme